MCQRHLVRGSYLLLSCKRMLIDDFFRGATNDSWSWNMWYTLCRGWWCVECRSFLSQFPPSCSHQRRPPRRIQHHQQDLHPQASGRTMIDWLNVNTMCKRLLIVVSIIHCWSFISDSRRCREPYIQHILYLCLHPRIASKVIIDTSPPLPGWKPKLVRLMIDWLIVLLPRKKEMSREKQDRPKAKNSKFVLFVVLSLGNASCFIHESIINVTYCGARAVA